MVKKNEPTNLTRQDWIDRGRSLLAAQGVAAVRVEPLAKLIRVTKGSFYWHFKNREDLLDAILQDWIVSQTNSVMEQVEERGGTPQAKLLYLFELAVQDTGEDAQLEQSIRLWAAMDQKIAALLAEVDQRRLDYTQALFIQVGFEPPQALIRARLIYYSLIGEWMVGIRQDPADRLAEARSQYAILIQPIEYGKPSRSVI
jgi:AcrR family transcriptional regulator